MVAGFDWRPLDAEYNTIRSAQPAFSPDRRDVAALAVLLLVALVLRLAFFRGIVSVDDFNYLRHAAEVWRGRFDISQALYLHATRPLMFVPVAWMFAIFGVSETSAIAWPLAASLAALPFVYGIAARLYGREYGVVAGLMATVLPLMVAESTRLLPGGVTNLIVAASVLFYVIAEQGARRRRAWLLAAGVTFGAMQLAGELGLVCGLFFPLALVLWRRHSLWSYWPLAAGFAAVIALTMAYYAMTTGDAFFKRAISQTILSTQFEPLDPAYYLRILIHPLLGHGGIFYLAGIAAFIDRRRETLLLAAWFIATWLFIEYGSSSLDTYRPLYKSVRYLSVVSVPGALLAGVALIRLRAIIEARRGVRMATVAVFAIGATVVALSLVTLARGERSTAQVHAKLTALEKRVQARRGEIIYVTHWLWNTRVGFFMGFEDDYFPSGYDPYHAVHLETADADSRNRYVQTLSPGDAMPAGVLLHDERLFEYSRGRRDAGTVGPGEIPEQLAAPPEDWRLIERIDIGGGRFVAVYDIPAGARWPGASTP